MGQIEGGEENQFLTYPSKPLPHLAGIFRFTTTELCCIIVPIVSDSIAILSSSLFTTITIMAAFVTDPTSRASVRSPTREEHIYGIREIGDTIRLELGIFFVRCDGTRPPYSTIVVIAIVGNRNATKPKAQ
jgi:hypothetical protein